METLVEQPKEERLKSFDLLAGVNMMRYDIENFGDVLPETKERVCDEELSYLVEGVGRASRTSFVMKRNEEDLLYFNEGQWENYSNTLEKGYIAAKQEAIKDPRRDFLVDLAEQNRDEAQKMHQLAPGEQMIWYSPYRHDVEELHGAEFLTECGMQPTREMGFIYRAIGQDDDTVLLESQTVDRSDMDAFEAVELAQTLNPDLELDEATSIYDDVLSEKHGTKFYAGRLGSEHGENAWEIVKREKDLIEFHLAKLENISKLEISESERENRVKEQTYGVWAAFKKRIDAELQSSQPQYVAPNSRPVVPMSLEVEVHAALQEFVARGEVLAGCGGSISMPNGIMAASAEAVFSSIFGDSDEKGPLTFECGNGHLNTRPRGQLIDNCTTCKVSVSC